MMIAVTPELTNCSLADTDNNNADEWQ